MIAQTQIDEIIEKNDIVSVVGEYVRLTRKGQNDWGLCPFHNEKTPSFSVNETKQIFKCFGCGKGGNVIHFIMLAEGLDYVGALQFLAKRVGIEIRDDRDGRSDERRKLKQDILALNKAAARFFFNNMRNSQSACAYLKKRGITVDIIKRFGIGYAQDSWDALIKHLATGELAVKPQSLVEAGLALKANDKERIYDRFRNRIMFPIFDVNGEVIAFGGRVMDDSQPKYLNSPETAAYSKGDHLYGLNYARKTQEKRVIITEGYMDCIALHQKGIQWAVASLGTALTQSQARLLRRYFDEVYIGYDSDGAGKSATIRGLDILASQGLRVRVLDMAAVDANVKDPDEFLRKHTVDEFMIVVDKAKTLTSFKLEAKAVEFPPSDDNTILDFASGAAVIIAGEPTETARKMYIKEICNKYGIDEAAISEDIKSILSGATPRQLREMHEKNQPVKRVRRNQINQDAEPQEGFAKKVKKVDGMEKRFILCLSENPSRIERYAERAEGFYTNPANERLFNALRERAAVGELFGKDSVLADTDADNVALVMKEANEIKPTTSLDEVDRYLLKARQELAIALLARRMEETADSAARLRFTEMIRELTQGKGDVDKCLREYMSIST